MKERVTFVGHPMPISAEMILNSNQLFQSRRFFKDSIAAISHTLAAIFIRERIRFSFYIASK